MMLENLVSGIETWSLYHVSINGGKERGHVQPVGETALLYSHGPKDLKGHFPLYLKYNPASTRYLKLEILRLPSPLSSSTLEKEIQ